MSPAAIVFEILFGFAFTIAACYGAGRVLLARLRIQLQSGEAELVEFVTGSACVSMMVFVLAAIGLARPASFVVVGVLLIAFGIRETAPRRSVPLALPWAWKWLFLSIFAAYTVLYLSQAIGPEYSPDGSTYHLGLVARYLRQHGFGRITTSIYANLSQGLEMLFLFAFPFGRHSAAAMVHFAFFISLVFGMVTYSRRFQFPRAGIFAAILIYASPVFGFDGTAAYNDVAAACVVFFAFYLLEIWDSERQNALLIPIGLLAGFAYGIKYTAGAIALYAVGFVLWKSRSFRSAAAVAGTTAILILPWMIKDWVIVANPVSPFLNRWFPNPYVSAGFEHEFVRSLTHIDGYTLWHRFLDTTYRSGPTGAILGLAFLLTPVALVALRAAAGRHLLAAALIVGVVGGINIQTRFLLPAIPFVALGVGVAVMRFRAALAAVLVAHAILCWPTVLKSYADAGLRVRHFLPKQALRIESEDSTLSYRLPGYPVAKMIDQLVPPDGRVLCFASPPEAYTSRELLIYYESTFNITAIDILSIPSDAALQPTRRLAFSFPSQVLQGIRIVQVGENSGDQWSAGDIHLFNGKLELSRPADWKLSAKPNPFEIGDAFDGNPVTRWRSHETLYNGMRIEVDFRQPEKVDRVVIDCSHDQSAIRLHLEGRDGSGAWKMLSDRALESETRMPDLRRAAIQELRRRSITHLLIQSPFPGAEDMHANPQAWGLRLLGEIEQTRLYALP